MKRTLLTVMLLGSVIPAASQDFSKNATAGFTFLEVPVSARSAALAEAAVALSDLGVDAVFHNPAALGFLTSQHAFSVSYAPWLAEMKHYAGAYSFNSPFGVVAVQAVVFDFGTMTKTVRPTSGQTLYQIQGDFTAGAMAFGLTYSKKLTDQFAFGVTLKYVREGIDEFSASTFLFDGGVLYHTGLGSLRIGASLQHFGADTKYKDDPFKMPAMLRLGVATEVLGELGSEYRVTLSGEALHPSDADERVAVGVELAWMETVLLRGGYKFMYDEETYSFGVGIQPGATVPACIDFSYSPYGRLGNVLRFTLRLDLN
jgi:hypothetical protein